MDTLEALEKRLATTNDLRGIVLTMKSLSAVSIRQYEQAVEALRDYSRTIALGLQVVLAQRPVPPADKGVTDGATLAVVFGSDHGLCGRFNLAVAGFAQAQMDADRVAPPHRLFLAAGARAAAQLEADGARVERCLLLPGSVTGLTETAHDLLLEIDRLRTARAIGRVVLFHEARGESGQAEPRRVQLLPLDPAWLADLATRRWPSRCLPTHTMSAEALFAALVRQHLFIGLFRAAAESAATEHATRLAAMQAAERNIDGLLEETEALYRQKRQESITEELLDVVAGFEVLADA